jgi:hypothetical protein
LAVNVIAAATFLAASASPVSPSRSLDLATDQQTGENAHFEQAKTTHRA